MPGCTPTTAGKGACPLLAAAGILEVEGVNRLLDEILLHANTHEIHRKLRRHPARRACPPFGGKMLRAERGHNVSVVGPTFGASKPARASAITAKCSSAFSVWLSRLRHAPIPIPKLSRTSCSTFRTSEPFSL